MKKIRILFLVVITIVHCNAFSQYTPVFILQTGAFNPFDGVTVGTSSAPAFVDNDNDGDMDAFIGQYNGFIYYYKNTGTATNAVFTYQNNNNFFWGSVGDYCTPAFVDIDADGDIDAFNGEEDGNINYYENTGDVTNAVFTERYGSSNPLNEVDVWMGSSAISFVDIDGDGDFDAFVTGKEWGTIYFYENTGNKNTPTYTLQTGTLNPLDGVTANDGAMGFTDIDKDGDMDAFISTSMGTYAFDSYVSYYKNTGNINNPSFTLDTSSSDPFNSVSLNASYINAITFTDIDSDGDEDAFVGQSNGSILYYVNSSDSNATNGINIFTNNNSAIITYPNPANTELVIEYPSQQIKNNIITLFDVFGKQIFCQKNMGDKTILSIENLSEGNYILQVENSDEVIIKQIIINH